MNHRILAFEVGPNRIVLAHAGCDRVVGTRLPLDIEEGKVVLVVKVICDYGSPPVPCAPITSTFIHVHPLSAGWFFCRSGALNDGCIAFREGGERLLQDVEQVSTPNPFLLGLVHGEQVDVTVVGVERLER